MNESFELLSSMSPKLNGRQKTVKKAIKILALKRHIRRSSIYDKAPAINNEDLAIIEASTGSSESSLNFQKDKTNKNNGVIVIDSTDSEDIEDLSTAKSKKLSSKPLRNCNKNENKVDRIQEWLNNIEMDEKKDNLTFFSQVSTIYGDESPKFDPDGNGLAACSTFNDYQAWRFDELFVTDKNDLKNKPNDDLISNDSFLIDINTSLRTKLKEKSIEETSKWGANKHNRSFDTSKDSIDFMKETDLKGSEYVNTVVIDETLLTSDESAAKLSDSYGSVKLTPMRTPERPLLQGDNVTVRRRNAKIGGNPKNSPLDNSEETETMLDSLYGVKWRDHQNHVLPMSEPKKQPTTKNQNKVVVPNTERIMKASNKENILCSNRNPATKKLNFGQLKTPLASPWMTERFKNLVDSDSDSNSENKNEKSKGLENVKTKLSFCENSTSIKTTNVKNTKAEPAEEINVNRVNFDESYSESLEETIRKKSNNFKVPTKINKEVNKKGSKNKNSNKENNPDNENKGKVKTTRPQKETKEKCILENGDKKSATKGVDKKVLKNKPGNEKRSESISSANSFSEIEISSDEEYDKEVTRMYKVKRKSIGSLKERSYSFLESLSGEVPLEKCDMTARIFRTSFKQYRDELRSKLFALYNEQVFDNAIPSDTELEWNDKLRNTAGLCYCKKITHKSGKVVRKVRIALSSKVLDSPDRLRDTLIHEMCHAGTWIVNQISNGHGVYWKNWAFKAMKVFPELPPISRCHSYQIRTKYTYKCTSCGYSFGRHSKSLNTERKRCGVCYGKFELLLNKTYKSGETRSVPVTPRKQATAFSLFVKEHYGQYKEPSKKHGDVMKILGQKFSELKVKNAV